MEPTKKKKKKKKKRIIKKKKKTLKKKRRKIVLHIGGKKKVLKKRKRKRKRRRKRRKIDWEVWNQPFYTARRCGYEIFIQRSHDYLNAVGKSNDVAKRKKYNQIREEVFDLINRGKVFPEVYFDEDVSPLKQVNIDLYTHENLEKREKLFENRRIRFWIFEMFKCIKKNVYGEIPRSHYLELLKIAHRMLLRKYCENYLESYQRQDLDYYCSYDIVRGFDFEKFPTTEESVPWEQFYKGIFEITDAWTTSTEEDDYVKFIRRLIRKMCRVMKIRKYKIHKMKRIYGTNSSQVILKHMKRIICDETTYERIMKSLDESRESLTSASLRFTKRVSLKKRRNKKGRITRKVVFSNLDQKKEGTTTTTKDLEVLTVKSEQEFIRNLREKNLRRVKRMENKRKREILMKKRRERMMKRKKRLIERRKKKRLEELMNGRSYAEKKRPSTVHSKYMNVKDEAERNATDNLFQGERKEVKMKTMTFDLLAGLSRN